MYVVYTYLDDDNITFASPFTYFKFGQTLSFYSWTTPSTLPHPHSALPSIDFSFAISFHFILLCYRCILIFVSFYLKLIHITPNFYDNRKAFYRFQSVQMPFYMYIGCACADKYRCHLQFIEPIERPIDRSTEQNKKFYLNVTSSFDSALNPKLSELIQCVAHILKWLLRQ